MQCARRLDSFPCLFLIFICSVLGRYELACARGQTVRFSFQPITSADDFTDKSFPSVWRRANQRWSYLLEWNPANSQSYTAHDCPFRSTSQDTRPDWFLLMTPKGIFFLASWWVGSKEHLDELHWRNQTVEGTKVLTTNSTSSLWIGMLL